MIEGYIFDYGGTIDTAGCHWGIKIWHTYQQLKLPITEQQYRKAYVYAEQTLGKTPIIQPNFTFRRTLEEKIKLHIVQSSFSISFLSSIKFFNIVLTSSRLLINF